MLKEKLQSGDVTVEVELAGPFDKYLKEHYLNNVKVQAGHDVFFGYGVTYRQAVENAIRNTLRTPHEPKRQLYTNIVQAWLNGRPDADEVQGDVVSRVVCAMKVKHVNPS